jgi:tetratricopeptide (TPR) repeat protein
MQIGDRVANRFVIEREAGAGGMGTVFHATDLRSGGAVALKILHRQGASEGERFAREAAVLAELSHPGIVRYVAHGLIAGGGPWLAMEWLEGETLSARLSRGRLGIAETVMVAQRVSDALAVAHGRGIVHRDIKPSNLFLPGGELARTKLLDFGVARRLGEKRSLTQTGAMIGTIGYMAPEQARGVARIDARADVFALGCVLFECLTATPAFLGENMMAVLAKILLEETPKVRDLCPHAPRQIEDLIARMLAKEPAQRPADAGELTTELGELIARLGPAIDAADTRAAEGLPPRMSTRQVKAVAIHDKAERSTLTGTEQRVVCVVLVGSPANAMDDTLEGDGAATPEIYDTTRLRAAVEPFGAHLEVLANGAMVVTLGASGAATDQAVRAARSALALRGLLPNAPIVLATGRGVVQARLPLGQVIDRGVRALRSATTGDIRLDEVTAGLLDARFDIGGDDVGLHLRGMRDLAEPPRTLLGHATACVGRDRELAMLEGIFDECLSEPVARAALVTGPAGSGKSRVRHEFLRRLAERGERVEVFFGHGDSLSAGSPFGMIAPALRRAAGITGAEPLAGKQQKLRARLARHLDEKRLSRACEFLGEMVGVPAAGEPSEALRAARADARLMGDAMAAAWQDFLDAETQKQPVLLVLEDLHWGDVPSVHFIDGALRALGERPIMALALARPEVHQTFPELWHERDVQELRLAGLTKKASEKLVKQILGDDVGAEKLAQIVARADGNPFYLEELIRAVAAGAQTLPDSVLGMVQARLDALGSEAKRLLRAASVFGQTFWRGGVLALLGRSENTAVAAEWIEELVAREIVIARPQAAFPGENEYSFRHALLREAAYEMLTDADRALAHRLAGQWLEQAGERDPTVMAEHFDRGGDPAGALRWYRKGAAQALEGNDLAAAIARAEKGVACGADGEALGELRLLQAQAHFWRGDYATAAERATEGAQQAAAGTPLWFQAVAEAAAAIGTQGDYDHVEEWVKSAMTVTTVGDGSAAQFACLGRAAGYLVDGGRTKLASAVVRLVSELAGGTDKLDAPAAALIHHAEAKLASTVGDQTGVLLGFENALRRFQEAGDARHGCENGVNVGWAYSELGDFAAAEAALSEGRATAERMGLASIAAGALHNLGPVLMFLGRTAEAREAELKAIEFYRRQGDRRLEGLSRAYLALILIEAGNPAEAERAAKTAADVLEEVPPTRAVALAALARAVLEQGRPAEALAHTSEALALPVIEERESLLRLVYAESLDRLGERDEAREAIRLAQRRLLERASHIREPAWRDSFLHRLPENARTLRLAREWGVTEESGNAIM